MEAASQSGAWPVNVTENYRHKKAIEFSSLNVLLLYNRVHVESA